MKIPPLFLRENKRKSAALHFVVQRRLTDEKQIPEIQGTYEKTKSWTNVVEIYMEKTLKNKKILCLDVEYQFCDAQNVRRCNACNTFLKFNTIYYRF